MRSVLLILFVFAVSLAVEASTASVRHVSDGDSFILASGERVRMIGVNAPELKDVFGQQSKDHLAKLIRGKTVMLEGDPQNDDRDVHGRLLRFVTLDGVDINRQMIVDGYAYAFLRYQFAREKRDAYREAERTAKAARVGIWASEIPAATPDTAVQPGEPNITAGAPIFSMRNVLIIGGVSILIFLSLLAYIVRRG